MNSCVLTVLKDKNNEVKCKTSFLNYEFKIEEREISNANYEPIIKYRHHIIIHGVQDMKCGLSGDKTNIIIETENKSFKLYSCTVEQRFNDGYDIVYRSMKAEE